MSIIWGIIIGVIVLTILVAAHELGHALVARRYGTIVEEFGFGFPPRAWGKRIKKSFLGKNVLYSINWLPLGGFVKMKGEHDDDAEPGDYGAMTYGQKTLVLLAGVLVNWLLAVVVVTVLAWIGLPKVLDNQFTVASDTTTVNKPVQVVSVEPGLPASQAGLEPGDKILTVNGVAIETTSQLTGLTEQDKGREVKIGYNRNGQEATASLHLRAENADGKGIIGVGLGQQQLMRSTWSAPIVGVGTTTQMTWVTLKGVVQVIWNGLSGLVMKVIPAESVQNRANAQLQTVSDSIAGPVSIFGILFPAAEQQGVIYVLLMAGIISLTLAVMNVLPIPALDGGRWFVMTLYKLRGKKLTKETEEKIHGTGFLVLMVLMVLVTIADIGKFGR